MSKLSDIREEYTKGSLHRENLMYNPFEQFSSWMKQAIDSKCQHPNAVSLATVDQDGMPNARIVLLKDATEEGFVFFTNYNSQKGTELSTNSKACLNFFWGELERQVRINGTVEKIPAESSEEYFQSRPRESQLGALASPQSQVVPDDDYLKTTYKQLEQKYEGITVQRPKHWGGFILKPQQIEFWQGRTSRLHDRFRYKKEAGSWIIERLAP